MHVYAVAFTSQPSQSFSSMTTVLKDINTLNYKKETCIIGKENITVHELS